MSIKKVKKEKEISFYLKLNDLLVGWLMNESVELLKC